MNKQIHMSDNVEIRNREMWGHQTLYLYQILIVIYLLLFGIFVKGIFRKIQENQWKILARRRELKENS